MYNAAFPFLLLIFIVLNIFLRKTFGTVPTLVALAVIPILVLFPVALINKVRPGSLQFVKTNSWLWVEAIMGASLIGTTFAAFFKIAGPVH